MEKQATQNGAVEHDREQEVLVRVRLDFRFWDSVLAIVATGVAGVTVMGLAVQVGA
jgi:hypothetical protein